MKFTIFFNNTSRPFLDIKGVGKPHYSGELIYFKLLNEDGSEGETKWWFTTRSVISIERVG